METDEPYDPIHIGSLGVNGIVVETEHLSDLVEELRSLTSRRVRHDNISIMAPKAVDTGYRAKLPENSINTELSGQNGK